VREESTLAGRLGARRRQRFVGRRAELALFDEVLSAGESPYVVLFVHGPGGIGKTSLLAAWADLAVAAGRRCVRVDARDVAPSAEGVLDALRSTLGVAPGADPVGRVEPGCVLMVDTYELFEAIDSWVRGSLIPGLPADAIVVLAGRNAPGHSWQLAPWAEVTHVTALRNLDPDESRTLLRSFAVDPDKVDDVVGLTHGHPLGLALVADTMARGGAAAVEPMAPDLVRRLVQTFVDNVPDATHRKALEACAVIRVTTEPALRHVLGLGDAHDLFDWLRGLSFVEAGPDGVFPHDLARDAIMRDLLWRDPDAFRAVFSANREYMFGRLLTGQGIEQQRAIFDLQHYYRHVDEVSALFDWTTFGQAHIEPAGPARLPAVLEIVERWFGRESVPVARHWCDRFPDGALVAVDRAGAVRGMFIQFDLGQATAADFAIDPGAGAAWDWVQRTAPTTATDAVPMVRFWADRDKEQDASTSSHLVGALSGQTWLTTPNLSMWLGCGLDADKYRAYSAFFDFDMVEAPEFETAGRSFGMMAHDFRVMPIVAWLDRNTEKLISRLVDPTSVEPAPIVLSYPVFQDAARQLLRDLHRSDRLRANPLARSRLVGGDDPTAELSELVHRAAVQLREDPRDLKLYRAVERTYLKPAPSQEKAAELLDLPFSTYRRHLTAGVERIVASLWQQELVAVRRVSRR
jgi:hypothetical protein